MMTNLIKTYGFVRSGPDESGDYVVDLIPRDLDGRSAWHLFMAGDIPDNWHVSFWSNEEVLEFYEGLGPNMDELPHPSPVLSFNADPSTWPDWLLEADDLASPALPRRLAGWTLDALPPSQLTAGVDDVASYITITDGPPGNVLIDRARAVASRSRRLVAVPMGGLARTEPRVRVRCGIPAAITPGREPRPGTPVLIFGEGPERTIVAGPRIVPASMPREALAFGLLVSNFTTDNLADPSFVQNTSRIRASAVPPIWIDPNQPIVTESNLLSQPHRFDVDPSVLDFEKLDAYLEEVEAADEVRERVVAALQAFAAGFSIYVYSPGLLISGDTRVVPGDATLPAATLRWFRVDSDDIFERFQGRVTVSTELLGVNYRVRGKAAWLHDHARPRVLGLESIADNNEGDAEGIFPERITLRPAFIV